MMPKRLCVALLSGFMACGHAHAQETGDPWAQEVGDPWMPVYGAELNSIYQDDKYSSLKAAPKKCYEDADVLLCSQLVQTLSADTLFKAKGMFLGLALNSSILLPDGKNLGFYALYNGFLSALSDAALYSITYNSTTIKGKPTKLSGLVVMPRTLNSQKIDASGGIVVHMHATRTQQDDVPSNRSLEAYAAITAFAGQKWAVAMPDYLGYGVNKEDHPYSLGKLNAQSGIDIIKATRELSKYLHADLGKAIHVTGYSEGGGNALWLGRALEERASNNPSLQPTAIAPMSGPYDLSGATAKSFVDAQPVNEKENIEVKPALLAFAGVSTAQVTKEPLTSLLREALADEADGLFPGPYTENMIGTRLLTTAINNLDYLLTKMTISPPYVLLTPRPNKLLQPSLVNAIQTQDTTNPAMALWAQNNNLDWVPATPTYMLGVIQDPLVPFASSAYPLPKAYVDVNGLPAPFAQGNAQNALQAMRSRGANNNKVAWLGFNGLTTEKTTVTHTEGFPYCAIMASLFFQKGGTSLKNMPQLADP